MTADHTTIKVPRDLRDRIAARARADHVSFATAITHALDLADQRAFWSDVAVGNAALNSADRDAYVADHTLTDNLADADDDAVSAADAW